MSGPDAYYMRKCFALARRALGVTSPNPPVGSILVQDDEIIGVGWHEAIGEPHAEVVAIESADRPLKNSTLYVSLEPCNHHGKTPPCVEHILKNQISKVVYSVSDPNSDVAGGGAKRLREEGLEVVQGVLEEEGRELLHPWLFACNASVPHVTLLASCDAVGNGENLETLMAEDVVFAKRFERFIPYFDEVIWDMEEEGTEGLDFEALLKEERDRGNIHVAVFFNTALGKALFANNAFQRLLLCRSSRILEPSPMFDSDKESLLALKRATRFGNTSISVYMNTHV
jgi:pyrimidine deaminase RibD-like protein